MNDLLPVLTEILNVMRAILKVLEAQNAFLSRTSINVNTSNIGSDAKVQQQALGANLSQSEKKP